MNNTPNRAIRISKIFLLSFALAGLVSLITGIILLFIFRPYRYTDKAGEIYKELTLPDMGVLNYAYDPDRDKGITYQDSMGNPLPDSAIQAIHEQDYQLQMVDFHRRLEEKRKNRIFGGTAEFFNFCRGNDSPVTWNPMNIEGSIQLREDYLIERIKRILFFTMLSSFTILYLVQFIKKHKIRLVIN